MSYRIEGLRDGAWFDCHGRTVETHDEVISIVVRLKAADVEHAVADYRIRAVDDYDPALPRAAEQALADEAAALMESVRQTVERVREEQAAELNRAGFAAIYSQPDRALVEVREALRGKKGMGR